MKGIGRSLFSRSQKTNGGPIKKDNGYHQKELDKKLVFSLSKSRIPNFKQLKYIKKYLNSTELWVIRISLLIILVNLIVVGTLFYINNLQVVAVTGGEYTEALLGSPKYVNPLYASVSDVDNDLTSLTYSSLFRRGTNGELVPDLVQDYNISDDSKVYTIAIRTDAKWHDETLLTVDDVIFTFIAIKDTQYKSPLKNSFGGVEIEKVDEQTIAFTLADPYAAFLELLTFGIIPANLWSQIPPESASLAELNLKPIGSGPYKFAKLVKDKTGNVREYYLEVNEFYYSKMPFINLKFEFFTDFETAVEAINNNVVNGISYLPPEYKAEILTPKSYFFHKLYLPQLTLLFINQTNNTALKDKAVRQALAYAIDRNNIINNTLIGDAYTVDGPILNNSFAFKSDIKSYDYNSERAAELLDSVDWKLESITAEMIAEAEENIESDDEAAKAQAETILALGEGKWRKKNNDYLFVSLSTVERNENDQIIEAIKSFWEAQGIKTITEVAPVATIQKDIIRPRNFDTLFYGQVVGADPDPYAFWHSSQTGENGFNIANFTNKEVDQLLEDARLSSNQEERKEKYLRFQEIIAEEVPAVFMYSPVYTYLQTNDIKGFQVNSILFPRDRFANINEWYIKTGKKLIWPGEKN